MKKDIKSILAKARPVETSSHIADFAKACIEACGEIYKTKDFPDMSFGELLAASFDLGTTAAYARLIGNNGWIFCRHNAEHKLSPTLFYPLVNVCPRCLVKNRFVFVPSRKPQSAQIGNTTSALTGAILNHAVRKNSDGRASLLMLGGSGDIDAVIQENENLCFLEIKASPLVTFPFATKSDDLKTTEPEGIRPADDHSEVVATNISRDEISVYLPEDNFFIPLGVHNDKPEWPYNELKSFIKNTTEFKVYVGAWRRVYREYCGLEPKKKSFWLSNGCGGPVPRPKAWPARRVGGGYETISDSKSSVGLDRTDDIKKGIYQVLKIGTHYKEFSGDKRFKIRTALVSNIHAIKHYDDYLKEFADLVWSVDSPERDFKILKEEDFWKIPADRIYSLYDGLIALTRSHIRDEWLKAITDFETIHGARKK